MRGSARKARAIVNSCFSPCDRFVASSSMIVSYPSGSVRTKWSTWASSAAAMICVLGRVRAAVGDVLADRAVEQPRVLEDHAEGTPQAVARHLTRIDAVDRDLAAIDLVEAHEQVDQRGLAGSGGTDDGHRVALCGDEAQVLDQRCVRAGSGRTRRRRRPGRERCAGRAAGLGRRSPPSRRAARRRVRLKRPPTGARWRCWPPARWAA